MGSMPGQTAQGANVFERWRRDSRRIERLIFILVALVPMCAAFVLFWIYPMLHGVWGSLTLWRGFNPDQPFVGLRQYQNLFRDPIFVKALSNTFYYALLYLPAGIVLSMCLALAIEATGALRGLFRMLYFMPVVTSTIATALIWRWLYQPSLGLFNQILALLGLPAMQFLQSTTQALPSIVVYALWKNLGFNMVLFMAGLSAIDQTYYDAARVDGANRWQVFWHITLPLLQPTMVFVIVTGIIGSLQVFGPVYVMSSGGGGSALPGGPANATMVVSVYQWLIAFRELELGYGSAMGVVLFIIILVVTLVQTRFLRTRWEY
ncbi:MAG: sugar ABC transporter permease [Chloroflexi bacterium]|nr:sugar ABC transporter permease [Chloroflexota bacterium]